MSSAVTTRPPVLRRRATVDLAVAQAISASIPHPLTNPEANVFLWLLRCMLASNSISVRASNRAIRAGLAFGDQSIPGTGNHNDTITAALFSLRDMGLISIDLPSGDPSLRKFLIITLPEA